MADEEHLDKARELSTAIELVAAVAPAVLAADPLTGLIATLAVGGKRLVENHLLRRQKKLDESVQEGLTDLAERVDADVKAEEFVGLYIRARETAARSEREEKLRFIRNFLRNAVIEPTSRVEDKEPYLRQVDDFSAGELQILVGFCKATAEANAQSLQQFVLDPKPGFLMISAFARHNMSLGPSERRTPALIKEEARVALALRRFESAALLDGIRTGGVGEPYAYQTNAFTAGFLRFILDPC